MVLVAALWAVLELVLRVDLGNIFFCIFAELMFGFFKAFLVGICASAPLGPVVLYVIQNTLNHGRNAGTVSGLGSAVVDTFYAAVAVFALAVVQDFLDNNNALLMVVGGGIIAVIGLFMAFRARIRDRKCDGKVSVAYPVRAALMALSNPGALALMFGLMALFNVNTDSEKLITVAGVAVGATLFWISLAWFVDKIGNRLNIHTLLIVNRIVGGVVAVFGTWMLINGIISQ